MCKKNVQTGFTGYLHSRWYRSLPGFIHLCLRRKSLTRRPAMDLLSPLRRIYFQRNRWSSVPATCVESHWAENETMLSLYRSLAALTARRRAQHDALYSLMFPEKRPVPLFTAARIVLSTHVFWLENVLIVTVSVACSVSVLTKLNATSVNSLISDELAWNMSQSMSSRTACSMTSE